MSKIKTLSTFGSGLVLVALAISPAALAASGYTFTDDSGLSGNSATQGMQWTSIASSANGQHLVAVESAQYGIPGPPTNGDIWTSSNGGTTWTDDSLLTGNSGSSGLQWASVASSANGEDLAAVANSGGVWTSQDGGTTWTDVANFTMSGGIWEAVTMSADGKYLHAMPMSGDVWSSSDYGATWRNDTWITGNGSTHQDWQSVASSADGQEVVGGVDTGDIWITHDDGETWVDNSALAGNTAMSGQAWTGIAVSADGEDILAAASGGDLWRSTNGGTSWTNTSTLTGNGGTVNQSWASVASSADGQNLTAVATGGDIWTSQNGGTNWADVTSGGPMANLQWSAVASNITGGKLAALTGGMYTTGDVYSGINTNLPQVTSSSLTNPVTSTAATIQTPTDTTLTCSSSMTEASLAKQDTGYTYPLGLVKLCYTTVLADDQVSVTFVTNLTPSQVVARDFNTTTDTYSTVPGAVITEVSVGGQHALQLTYTITDNGALDANPAVSFVTDPVGLAVASTVTVPVSAVKAPNTGFGAPAQSGGPALELISLGALAAVSTGAALLYQEKAATKVKSKVNS